MTPADTHDTRVSSLSARRAQVLCAAPLQRFGRMQQARGQELAQWCQVTGDWELEVVERPSGTRGFSVVPAPDGWWSEHSVGFLVTEE